MKSEAVSALGPGRPFPLIRLGAAGPQCSRRPAQGARGAEQPELVWHEARSARLLRPARHRRRHRETTQAGGHRTEGRPWGTEGTARCTRIARAACWGPPAAWPIRFRDPGPCWRPCQSRWARKSSMVARRPWLGTSAAPAAVSTTLVLPTRTPPHAAPHATPPRSVTPPAPPQGQVGQGSDHQLSGLGVGRGATPHPHRGADCGLGSARTAWPPGRDRPGIMIVGGGIGARRPGAGWRGGVPALRVRQSSNDHPAVSAAVAAALCLFSAQRGAARARPAPCPTLCDPAGVTPSLPLSLSRFLSPCLPDRMIRFGV